MAKLLLGKEVSAAMIEVTRQKTDALRARGIVPTLAIVRCGENASDLTYEKSAEKRAAEVGANVVKYVLREDADKAELLARLDAINADTGIHGCLMFRPLPEHLRAAQREICNRLAPEKDVDGMTDLSAAGVYTGVPLGYPPCTAQACMEILAHYGIDCTGKNAVVIGRSLVVGRPLALLLLSKNATVTVCHTKTADTAAIARRADILISAAGAPGSLTKDFVRPGQTVLDVSVSWDESKHAVTGDAVFNEVEPIVSAITPVPGGVGSVTAAMLLRHVIDAAERQNEA